MVKIYDGTGKGYVASVTSENKMRTYATTASEISYESEANERAYSWVNATYDYTAGDTILLVKNTSTTEDLLIDSITVAGDTETEVVIHCPTCATPTGTAVTGVNMNRKSNKTADATAKATESTNSQANIIARILIDGNSSEFYNLNGSVVLGLNDCIAVDFTTNGGACYVTINGYYHTEK
jgi:hypothetical protein